MSKNIQKETSIFPNNQIQHTKHNQFTLKSWHLIVILLIALVVLKTFIYIKDGKRHGK